MTPPPYSGKLFMYPCAGNDIPEAVEAYGHLFDTFLFVDIDYTFKSGVVPLIHGWEFCRIHRDFTDPARDVCGEYSTKGMDIEKLNQLGCTSLTVRPKQVGP